MGAISLLSTFAGVFLLEWSPIARLDVGGMERWMVYPVVLWLVGFGGYLAAGRPVEALRSSLPAAASRAHHERKEQVSSWR
jgi:hypothetical protein